MPATIKGIINATAMLALLGLLMTGPGCTSQSRAKGAQSPPPPTLSAPVRYEEATARKTPAAEALPADEYAFLAERQTTQRTGTRSPLPMVKVPAVTMASTEKAPAPEPSKILSSHYIMRKGDTLYAVARKFNLPPKKLIAANSFKNPNVLPVGTKVLLPSTN